jgi:hypothetical protein
LARQQNGWLRARIQHFEAEVATAAKAEAAEDAAEAAARLPDLAAGSGSSGWAGGKVKKGAARALAQPPPSVPPRGASAAAKAAQAAAQLAALGPEPTAPPAAAGPRGAVTTLAAAAAAAWLHPPPAPPVVGPLKTCGICLGFLPGDAGGPAVPKGSSSSSCSRDRSSRSEQEDSGSSSSGDESDDAASPQSCRGNGNRKIVERYDPSTGQVLEEYGSVYVCATKIGFHKTSMSRALLKKQLLINGHALRFKMHSKSTGTSNSGISSALSGEVEAEVAGTRVRLSCCGNWFCGDCIKDLSASQVDKSELGRVTRNTIPVQCPFCRKSRREDLAIM